MSLPAAHHTLQRVVVRMLYDPAFCDQVYLDASRALAGLELSAQQQAWLTRADRRAYGADPLRRARGLHGLLEEFPASAALASSAAGSVQALEAFYSSASFHQQVQQRGSMARAFGLYLCELAARTDPRLHALATLESAIAAVRREALPSLASLGSTAIAARLAPVDTLVLAPHARAVQLPSGTVGLYQHLLQRLAALGPDPVRSLLDARLRLHRLPALQPAQPLPLLVLLHADGTAGIEELPPALAALLQAAALPCLVAQLLQLARELGAEPGEDLEILGGLIDDGLLLRV